MKLCRSLLLLLLVSTASVAQERQQSELGVMQNQLRQSRAEVDRLVEMRMRNDLGLPGDERDDRTFRSAVPTGTEAVERMQKQKEDEESAAAVLNAEYEKLRAAVDQLKATTEARLRAEAAENPLAVVPQAGVAVPQDVHQSGAPATSVPSQPREPGAQPLAEVASGVPTPTSLGPIVVQIHGSTDHQSVAAALFRAGQELMHVAALSRAQGHHKTAKELDDRGRDKLVRAIAELEPLLVGKEPAFGALFYLGRSRELLFRYAELHEQLSPTTSSRDYARREQEVREPFLTITARDVVKSGPRSDVDVLGNWGRAAQTAMTNFTWTNQHASYDAMATIKSLTWPGAR